MALEGHMNFAARRSSALLAALLSVLSAGCDKPPRAEPLFPIGQGIRKDATLSGLQAKGWTVCYQGAYSGTTSISTLLSGCAGRYLLLGCRASDTADALTLAAADLRTVVTQPDATGDHHLATAWAGTSTTPGPGASSRGARR
jgi:hypothetical protein